MASSPSLLQVILGPLLQISGLWGTVPELLFEKKELIPALQQLLTSYPNPTG
jgi:hypothetical protein